MDEPSPDTTNITNNHHGHHKAITRVLGRRSRDPYKQTLLSAKLCISKHIGTDDQHNTSTTKQTHMPVWKRRKTTNHRTLASQVHYTLHYTPPYPSQLPSSCAAKHHGPSLTALKYIGPSCIRKLHTAHRSRPLPASAPQSSHCRTTMAILATGVAVFHVGSHFTAVKMIWGSMHGLAGSHAG